jgi:hypothetical protein
MIARSADHGALLQSCTAFLPKVLNWIETLRPEESSLVAALSLTMTLPGSVWIVELKSVGKHRGKVSAGQAFWIFLADRQPGPGASSLISWQVTSIAAKRK